MFKLTNEELKDFKGGYRKWLKENHQAYKTPDGKIYFIKRVK